MNHLGAESLARYKQIVASMSKKAANHIDATYWYLSILGVTKQYQQQSFGRQLLNPVLAKTDHLKVPTYLETFTEDNLLFYRKLGYEVIVEYMKPNLAMTCWILGRESR